VASASAASPSLPIAGVSVGPVSEFRRPPSGKSLRRQIESNMLRLTGPVQDDDQRLVLGTAQIRKHLGVLRIEGNILAVE
jgi:hypothetical protein